ncbi:hypothetical protein BLOT_002836 [Blomia tropicalis]|nr:hypothetical protein BLOT_002836 [Blomia tropicalis]
MFDISHVFNRSPMLAHKMFSIISGLSISFDAQKRPRCTRFRLQMVTAGNERTRESATRTLTVTGYWT